MTFSEYRDLVLSDLYRVTADVSARALIRQLVLGESFKFVFWWRTSAWLRTRPVLRFVLYPWARWMLRRLTYRLGISIPLGTQIGAGFYIGHFGGIVVNVHTRIGRNCNISHGVTLGQANRGPCKGYPVVGDNVYIGPGAKIIGAVRIGDHSAVGANCVVTKDVPDHAVVVGIPGRMVSSRGSEGYVNRIDYDAVLM